MIAMPQATAIRKFSKYLVNLLVKINKNQLTVCEIFFKLKFSKSIKILVH